LGAAILCCINSTFAQRKAGNAVAAQTTDTIYASAGTGGNINPSGTVLVTAGHNQSFTITPNENYYINDVLVDGSSVGPVDSYTFTSLNGTHTISVTFLANSFTIIATADANGNIMPSGDVPVTAGGNQSFSISANTGYHIQNVLVNGVSVGAVSSYPFTNVQQNDTILALFAIDTVTLVSSAGAHGTISPLGTLNLTYGSSQTYAITPDSGYHVGNVTIDTNTVQQGITTKTFLNITRNHTIDAEFNIDTFYIYDSTANHGSILPSGNNAVTFGSSFTATITPNTGYHIINVNVDGVSQGAITSYPFTNVIANHTVAATFAIDTLNVTSSAGPNGVIFPSGLTKATYGSSLHFSVVPNSGFRVASITDGETSEPVDTQYQLTNITSAHTISVTFIQDTLTITASANSHGTISPAGTVKVASDSNQTFALTPAVDYQLDSLLVDGSSVTPTLSYQFTNVIVNHTIRAVFTPVYDTVFTTVQGAGTISPSGQVSVMEGSTQSFTITPDSTSVLTDVIVDGSSVGAQTSYSFPNISTNHTIKAIFNAITFTIAASSDTNGTISPSGNVVVTYGVNQTFTITPKGGYHIVQVLVDSVSKGAINTYTFSDVKANHTIQVHFAINTYTISISAGSQGTTSPVGPITADSGTTQTIVFVPDTGYHVVNVTLDATSEGAIDTLVIPNVHGNHSVSVTFAINTYTISLTAGPNGTVLPNAPGTFNYDSTQTFTFTPSQGYHVDSVVVDTTYIGSPLSYTFTAIKANHSLRVIFSNTYTINASVVGNGLISPSGAVLVVQGTSQTFTIAADSGYHLLYVKVDTVSQGVITAYNFPAVNANHTIVATFAIDTFHIVATSGAQGSISPSGNVAVTFSSSQKFTITPETGYHIVDVMEDTTNLGAVTTYTFSNIASNHTITASFAINQYVIISTAGANGSISPSGIDTVDYDSSQTFTITPNPHYHILNVVVDTSQNKGAISSFVFSAVTRNHTIGATFAIDSFAVNISNSGGGRVSSVPNLSLYPYGTAVILSAIPDLDYAFTGWSGDTTASDSTITVYVTKTTDLTASFSILPAYNLKYRTATYLDWWSAKDASGDKKPVKRAAAEYDFQFEVTAPDTGYTLLTLYFGADASGSVNQFGQSDTIRTFSGLTDAISFSHSLDSIKHVTLSVIGRYFKGSRPKVSYSWNNGKKATAKTFDFLEARLPNPDLLNVLEEMYPAAYPAGLLLGVPGSGKSAANSVLLKSYKDAEKSIGSGLVAHDTSTSCLDLPKQANSLAPEVMKDGLFANLLSLRLNTGASLVGKFPNGFGELTYINPSDSTDPANGMSVNEIANLGDAVLSCVSTSTHITREEMYQLLFKLNGAFADSGGTTPIDTVSFAERTTLLGFRPLIDAPFLHPTPGVVPAKINPFQPEFLNATPNRYSLEQNYPNPFNPATTIEYSIKNAGRVTLVVYNILGQEVAHLVDAQMNPGKYTAIFNAGNYASGEYIYRLTSAGQVEVKKMVLVK
jgi:hypothetical protein